MRDLRFIKKVVKYFNENNSTVRQTAQHFKISKSAVYVYLTKRMPNPTSTKILEKNRTERHIRGGLATQAKYKALKANTSNNEK